MRIPHLVLGMMIIVIFNVEAKAQQKHSMPVASVKPKLVVGLVIDQMRWDYLYRFKELYGQDGFNRLLNQGFSYENTMVPYTPTYTAPGHTCIFTGSVPAVHGIVGNNWYDKKNKKGVYCTDDPAVNTVGSNSKQGEMSPRNMWTTTIGDELRLSDNFQSKVIGVAVKDRGAILPAGHSANAAYWLDTSGGKFISSTYYMKSLPGYVEQFNSQLLPEKYMQQTWNTLLPIQRYTQSTEDDKPYEDPIPGATTVTFPHDLSLIKKYKYEAFKYTPFAASLTFDFAKAIVENEKMGLNQATDFLTISISSTDYAGHHFGPNSIEVEDTYLRLDRDIASFLNFLDAKIGKGNYLLFLSADHAVAHAPGFMEEHHLPGGSFTNFAFQKKLNASLFTEFGIDSCISSLQNFQVYVDDDRILKAGKDPEIIRRAIITLLKQEDFITDVVTTNAIAQATIPAPQRERMINGYNASRSGDIQFTIRPGYFEYGTKGVSHGVWNPYDAHIPLLFYGWHVIHGKTNREVYMTDIAPTIAAMLQIQMPNGSVGKVLPEMVGEK